MAEVDWVAMLAAGEVNRFNTQRSERSRPDLFAADLAGKPLVGADLSNANLEKSDLTGADLTEANLMRANLSGIDGSGMKLVDAIGMRARFKEAWMDEADLSGADFAQGVFTEANLSKSTGRLVQMGQARLKGCNAEGAVWPEADLSEARLHQGVFRGADLRNADLTAALGAEVDLSSAILDGIVATEAKFPGARLVGARVTQARLQRVNLSNADLSGADLTATDLSQANLSGANLTGANLTGAVLADANLEGAILDDVTFTEADLSGIDPADLGLSDEDIASLAAWGVPWDPDAAWRFSAVSVARNGKRLAVVWTNTDLEGEGDEARRSVRWIVLGGRSVEHGVVPVPADAVMDLQVSAEGDGFLVVVLRDRPEGVVVGAYPLAGGQLSASRGGALGYEPVVKPVLRQVDGRVHMLGLARRGPTLVVTDLSADPPAVLSSSKVATAQGFLRGQPVLACKGGVVIPVVGNRAGSPRRTPEGFPGSRGLVATITGEDVLMAVWVQPRIGDRPGGLRTAGIGPRHAPVPEVAGAMAGVVGLDAVQEGEGLRVLWAVAGDDGIGATILHTMMLPDGEPRILDAPDDIVEIRMSDGVAALVRNRGEVVLIEPATGKELARAGA